MMARKVILGPHRLTAYICLIIVDDLCQSMLLSMSLCCCRNRARLKRYCDRFGCEGERQRAAFIDFQIIQIYTSQNHGKVLWPE